MCCTSHDFPLRRRTIDLDEWEIGDGCKSTHISQEIINGFGKKREQKTIFCEDTIKPNKIIIIDDLWLEDIYGS